MNNISIHIGPNRDLLMRQVSLMLYGCVLCVLCV